MTPTTKLGGLPVWAWGLVALAGIGLGLYLRRRAGGASGSSSVAAGVPTVSPLGAASGGGSSGTDASASGLTLSALDPYLASLLGDAQSNLVNESQIFAGLASQGMSVAASTSADALGLATDLFSSVRAMQPAAPVVYNLASSPGPSSGAGLAPPSPTAVTQSVATPTPAPTPVEPWTPPAPEPVAAAVPVWDPPNADYYGDSYQPAGTVLDSNTIQATTYTTPGGLLSPGGGVYRIAGGDVYYQSNKGPTGKKPLY